VTSWAKPPTSLPVEALDNAAKTYLFAIGAAAIYVSADHGVPVGIGATRDLDQALRHLRNIISPTVSFEWAAWSPRYDALCEIAREIAPPTAMTSMTTLVTQIETAARSRGIALTPHHRALERAQVYAKYLDDALAVMQRNGEFSAFNQAYRAHRLERSCKGESVQPFWAVMIELRSVVIRALVANKKNRLQPQSAIEEIRKHFPWFSRAKRNGRHTRSGRRR